MEQIEERLYISRLIAKELLGTLADEERDALAKWREGDATHQAAYDEIIQRLATGKDVWQELDAAEREAGLCWQAFSRECKAARRRRLWWRYAAAAVVLVAVGIGAYRFAVPRNADVPQPVPVAQQQPLAPDSKVVLILSDNRQISLTQEDGDARRIGDMAVVNPKEQELVYDSEKKATKAEKEKGAEMNTIRTTTGGFYTLTLSDGTRVWLNSESEIEFPILFGDGEREVRLNGEAFFEVARDTARPFIVTAGDVRTRVLGTSFDIKSYSNEPAVTTTLFSGKVEVAPLKDLARKVTLFPGLQASWDERAGEMEVQEADLSRIAAWKEGMFLFRQEDIRNIARQIERWYGVTCVLQMETQNTYTFSGSFSRDDSLESILDAFSFSGELDFRIARDTVYMTEMTKK